MEFEELTGVHSPHFLGTVLNQKNLLPLELLKKQNESKKAIVLIRLFVDFCACLLILLTGQLPVLQQKIRRGKRDKLGYVNLITISFN